MIRQEQTKLAEDASDPAWNTDWKDETNLNEPALLPEGHLIPLLSNAVPSEATFHQSSFLLKQLFIKAAFHQSGFSS
jgi:hypothetical protein